MVEGGWSIAHAAAVFNVSWPTAKRWAERYRQAGQHGMGDRSSRPHRSPLRRAVAWFTARGTTVQRVLSDNGSAYRSRAWRQACADLDIKPRHTRPYRPQTNGKIERFHRTMADGWAFARMCPSESTRFRRAA